MPQNKSPSQSGSKGMDDGRGSSWSMEWLTLGNWNTSSNNQRFKNRVSRSVQASWRNLFIGLRINRVPNWLERYLLQGLMFIIDPIWAKIVVNIVCVIHEEHCKVSLLGFTYFVLLFLFFAGLRQQLPHLFKKALLLTFRPKGLFDTCLYGYSCIKVIIFSKKKDAQKTTK